ncbi:addiction module toxin RelE [Candidatus Woesearchaeota archaeon]|nr:addiction module toxin RelE [Candidatus Woesearchaeota archaeon]
MRSHSPEEKLKKILEKLYKKDRKRYEIIMQKMQEILTCSDVNHYKNLRSPLQHLKRVHIDSHFVLVFRYDVQQDHVLFYDLDHHDSIYH